MPIFGDIDKRQYTDLLKDNVSSRIKPKSEPVTLLEEESSEEISEIGTYKRHRKRRKEQLRERKKKRRETINPTK